MFGRLGHVMHCDLLGSLQGACLLVRIVLEAHVGLELVPHSTTQSLRTLGHSLHGKFPHSRGLLGSLPVRMLHSSLH